MHPTSFFALNRSAGASSSRHSAKSAACSPSPTTGFQPRDEVAKGTLAFSSSFLPFFDSSDAFFFPTMPPPYEASTSSPPPPQHPHGMSSALASPPLIPTSPILCPPSPTPSMSPNPTRRSPPSPICPPPYCAGSPTLRAPLSPVSVEEMHDDPHYLATPTQRSYFVQLSDLFEETAPAKREEEDVELGRRGGGREMKEKVRAKRGSMQVPVLRKGGQLVGDDPNPRWCGCCTIS